MIYDNSSIIGNAISAMTTNMTGDLSLTFFLLVCIIALLFIGTGLPVEYILIAVFPLIFVMYLSGIGVATLIKPVFNVIITYIAIVFIKRFIFNS